MTIFLFPFNWTS